jgi:hypothetical protein
MELKLRDVCYPDFLNDHSGILINICFHYPETINMIEAKILEEIIKTDIPEHWDVPTDENLREVAQEILNEFCQIWNSEDFSSSEKYDELNEVYAYIEVSERNILPEWLCAQMIERYNAEISANGSIKINYDIPYIAIEMSDNEKYFFQGDEAENLLKGVPENIAEDEFLLATAQEW